MQPAGLQRTPAIDALTDSTDRAPAQVLTHSSYEGLMTALDTVPLSASCPFPDSYS